jgi:hypothetical protein
MQEELHPAVLDLLLRSDMRKVDCVQHHPSGAKKAIQLEIRESRRCCFRSCCVWPTPAGSFRQKREFAAQKLHEMKHI